MTHFGRFFSIGNFIKRIQRTSCFHKKNSVVDDSCDNNVKIFFYSFLYTVYLCVLYLPVEKKKSTLPHHVREKKTVVHYSYLIVCRRTSDLFIVRLINNIYMIFDKFNWGLYEDILK